MADEAPPQPDLSVGECTNSKSGAKRRASRAGTRSVASLTPDQLARKRANDREAQRSIRQRTKAHIEDLERRIRELSGGEDEKTFEEVQRRNANLEEELRQLKEILRRSETISAVSSPEVTPLMSNVNQIQARRVPSHEGISKEKRKSQDLTDLSASEARYSMDILDEQPNCPDSQTWHSHNLPGAASLGFRTSSAGDLLSSVAPYYTEYNSQGLPDGSSPDLSMTSNLAPNRRGASYTLRPDFGRSRTYPNGRTGGYQWRPPSPAAAISNLTGGMVSNPQQVRNHSNNMSSSIPFVTSPLAASASSSVSQNMTAGFHLGTGHAPLVEVPRLADNVGYGSSSSPLGMQSMQCQQPIQYWEVPLQFVPPTGPVDDILLGLLQRQRSLAFEGASRSHATGPYQPSLRALVRPEHSHSIHPVESAISSLIARTAMKGLAEKTAALLVIYQLVQWQISPSQETYNMLPEWYGPRPSQILTGHPIWSTLVIWGKLRDAVINFQEKYATDEFRQLYTSSLNVNWPYRDVDIMVYEGEEVRATDTFAQHIADLRNWSLDLPFQLRYPELRGECRFTEVGINGQMSASQPQQ